jgi:ribosomal protein S18 acetylase RimI-like enzyme
MPNSAPDITIRPATPEDADALAQLINFAGEGMPFNYWESIAEEGETPWDVGRRRAQREEGGFSYKNATIAELDGEAAACLIGYAIPGEPEPIDYDSMSAVAVPLQELENLSPGSWYVNVLAAFPEHRGKGLGTKLLEVAQERGADARCSEMSIIVSDANEGARRLYERCGYRTRARRELVRDDGVKDGRNWVLLVK